MKPPKILLRYFVEAVLIFSSVYGAFLLEDHRAKSEQEQLFAKRWDGLINSIEKDSLKLAVLLTGIDKTGLFDQETGLNSWVFRDSVVLLNYENTIRNGNIYPIVDAVMSHHFWALSYFEPTPYFQDIIENHPDIYLDICSENAQLCESLDTYFQYHRRIDRYNRYTREMQIIFWTELDSEYPNPRVASYADSLAIAKDFRSRNYILNRYRHNQSFTLPTVKAILNLNKEISPVLRAFDLKKVGVN